MKRIHSAFTLTELLVVIAVIGVLAALLMSALPRAHDQAEAAFCRNNLSQIGRALAIYASDFGKYPGTRSAPTVDPPDPSSRWDQIWDRLLLPCIAGNKAVFQCPSDRTPNVEAFFFLTNYTYGYNAYGTGSRSANDLNLGLGHALAPDSDPAVAILTVSAAQIIAPSEMIAVGDLNDLPSVFTTTIEPVATPPFAGSPAARHAAGANMVFCDGHTEYAKRTAWINATDAARRRWNNDHEPHPETW